LKEALVSNNESDEKRNNWFCLKNEIILFTMTDRADEVRQDLKLKRRMNFPISADIQPQMQELFSFSGNKS